MATLIETPTRIEAAGNKVKFIDEFIGKVNSRDPEVSVALMTSPSGWVEPGQTPEFDEYTIVLEGEVHVRTREKEFDVGAGQAIVVRRGEWVQYSSPGAGGARYVSVCRPAFSVSTVHRDSE